MRVFSFPEGQSGEGLLLQHLLNREDEGAQTQDWVGPVDVAQAVHDELHAVIVADGEDGAVHTWPGVAAIVWLTIDRTAALRLLPAGETAHHAAVQGGEHVVSMRLIE